MTDKRTRVKGYVDISSYTSNSYLLPNDGYIRVDKDPSTTYVSIRLSGSDGNAFDFITYEKGSMLYVKKGFRVRMINIGSNDSVYYFEIY